MSSNEVRAAIDASDLGKVVTLIKKNSTLGREARSYLLHKLSLNEIIFKKGFFSSGYKPLETILELLKPQPLSPQDEQVICTQIKDTSVLQVIRKIYKNIDCNRTPQIYSPQYPPSGYPPQSPYPPQGYQSPYPIQGYPRSPYPPQGYPQSPYPIQGYPRSPYSPQGYPPVYTGRAGVRSRTRYRKNRQRQRQRQTQRQTQKTQKRKSNK